MNRLRWLQLVQILSGCSMVYIGLRLLQTEPTAGAFIAATGVTVAALGAASPMAR